MKTNVLIVDDDDISAEMLEHCLSARGYGVQVAGTLAQARGRIKMQPPDLILLDVELPDGSGLDLIEELEGYPNGGIILVTRHGSTWEKANGLEIGADDYIAKPYDPRELLARVGALSRRLVKARGAEKRDRQFLRFTGWAIDCDKRALVGDGREVPLTPSELQILLILVRNPSRVMSREEIMEAANRHWYPSDRTVDNLVVRLRRKISLLSGHDPLTTVYGAGYIFEPGPNPLGAAIMEHAG